MQAKRGSASEFCKLSRNRGGRTTNDMAIFAFRTLEGVRFTHGSKFRNVPSAGITWSGASLHQPMTGPPHDLAGHIGRNQLRLVDQERAGCFLVRQDQERHVQLRC